MSDRIKFSELALTATGATTPRTMPDRLADVVNVRDFGAVGDNSTDDAAAIQAAIDAAFGPANSPHGTNATLNRVLEFPNGHFAVHSPLNLTQVRGGRIRGAGQLVTTINSNSSAAVVTDGLEACMFESMGFNVGSDDGNVAFDLDWSGAGSVGLSGNIFLNCAFSGGDYTCRIGASGHGGRNNQFYAPNFNSGAVAGLVAWAASATGNSVHGGGASQNGTAFWCKDGQIISINDVGLSGNTDQDILVDIALPVFMKGVRTESALMGKCTNPAGIVMLDGVSAAASVVEFFHTKGILIMDVCTTDGAANSGTGVKLCTDPAYAGSVYSRGCVFPGTGSTSVPWTNFFSGFAGSKVQNI